MDPSGSGALIALRSAAEGLRALGDTPQHRPQSPPQPPRGLWSGSDLFAFRPDVGSLRRSVPPTPGIPRGGACRAVGWGGGAVRGSVAVLGPPGTAPPPSPMSHTVRRGGCPLCEDGRWAGEGARQPYRPHCVCGAEPYGGDGGGGRHLGVTAAAGTGRACSGPAADVSSADKQPESGGDKRLLCSRPSGRTSSAGAEPPPIHPSPPLPSSGAVRGVGSGLPAWRCGVGMRDAGCGMRPSGRSAQSSRAVPAQS